MVTLVTEEAGCLATYHSNRAASGCSNMAEPDPKALGPLQQDRLRDWKIQTRVSNEKYLREHTEVHLLLSAFTRELLLKRPDNIREFAAGNSK
uniref:Uncharacterized protein n=1 Tax=Leptobrachium leishanense TaxID=445787 RepID=A0A8C5R1T6_9ANUR